MIQGSVEDFSLLVLGKIILTDLFLLELTIRSAISSMMCSTSYNWFAVKCRLRGSINRRPRFQCYACLDFISGLGALLHCAAAFASHRACTVFDLALAFSR